MFGNPKKVGGEVIIRCSNGDLIAGCMRKLGYTSSNLAKLWALRDGLDLTKQLNIENIFIEMDAEFLIYLLSNLSIENLILEPLLTECKNLMKIFPNCTVAHVYKEANRCADKLARMGADLQSNYVILYNLLILYFIRSQFACRTTKNPKVLFSFHGVWRTSRMTWRNPFKHQSTQSASFSQNNQNAPSQP